MLGNKREQRQQDATWPTELFRIAGREVELVVTLRTAKTLGLTVPQSLLASADDGTKRT